MRPRSVAKLYRYHQTFDRTAASFDKADHVAVAIHDNRWRFGLAEGEDAMAFADKVDGNIQQQGDVT